MSQGYTKGIPIDTDGTLSLNTDLLVPSQKAVKTYVDNGLSNKVSLTGNETIAGDKTFTGILSATTIYGDGSGLTGGITSCLVKNNTTVSLTGTLTETILYSVLIPAGTFQANDDFEVYLRFFGTNTATAKVVRVYFNDTNDLVTPILLARNQGTTSSAGGTSLHRNLIFKNSVTNQEILSSATNYNTDFNVTSTSLNTLSIDFTIDQYFIVTGQLADITDTMGMRNVRGQILR